MLLLPELKKNITRNNFTKNEGNVYEYDTSMFFYSSEQTGAPHLAGVAAPGAGATAFHGANMTPAKCLTSPRLLLI